MRRHPVFIIIVCLCFAFGAGSYTRSESLDKNDNETKAIKKVPYTYKSGERRDPFLSIIEATRAQREAKKKGTKGQQQQPLENYNLTQIRLIAIVWNKNVSIAQVGLPDNKFYTIKLGTSVGIHGGKVHEIKENAIVIREYKPDFKGILKAEDTVLSLRKEEGE
jgi:Tfp pilus assembly protein PilP